ncbi:MAG TPA: hypothetical protein VN939_07995 [Chthoniobacterales bacterium]|nr:hypothetical protein [Chthoniobacterales bacterium]
MVTPSLFPGAELGQPAVTPNGKYLYVAYNYEGNTLLNQVAMFDVATGKIVATPIAVGAKESGAWQDEHESGLARDRQAKHRLTVRRSFRAFSASQFLPIFLGLADSAPRPRG